MNKTNEFVVEEANINEDFGTNLEKINTSPYIDPAPRAEIVQKIINPTKWVKNGQYYYAAESTIDCLLPGTYCVESIPSHGICFIKHKVNTDKLLTLPDSVSSQIIKDVEYFWQREKTFKSLNYLWKRGILLYGPAGSGKTSTIQLLCNQLIDMGGLAIFVSSPKACYYGLQMLRSIQSHTPLIVIMEDLDALIHLHGETDILSLLDGEMQINNILFLATTNYPERLDKRLINRPSRFDIIRKINMPSAKDRKTYLIHKFNNQFKLNTDQLRHWVDSTEQFSLAHLKELIISVVCLNQPFDKTIQRLSKMRSSLPSSEEDNNPIGFA